MDTGALSPLKWTVWSTDRGALSPLTRTQVPCLLSQGLCDPWTQVPFLLSPELTLSEKPLSL